METTANVNSAKQTSTPSPIADHAGEDRISSLGDDVILHVLRLVADATDVVRTGALSRRWRGLWARAPVLDFAACPELESAGDVERYVAFVTNVLEQRARWEESIEILSIQLIIDMERSRGQEQLVLSSVNAAEGWIQYAARHAVTGFAFKLRLPRKKLKYYFNIMEKLKDQVAELLVNGDHDNSEEEVEDLEAEIAVDGDYDNGQEEVEEDSEEGVDDEETIDYNDDVDEEEEEESSEEGDDQETPVIDLDDLSSSANLETLRLDLHSVRVRLPSTVVFESLTYLELEFMTLEAGSGHLLSRLLSSSCCPCLQKLHMLYVKFKHAGTKQLVLENDALLELSLENMEEMESLELSTPNLLDLKIDTCEELLSVTVTAPELEQLSSLHNHWQVDIHGDLPRVWGLKIGLVSHMLSDDDINDTSIHLLQRCSSSTSDLLVYLDIPPMMERLVDVIKDKIPQLPDITSLAVLAHPMSQRHSFGDGVAGLLTRFNNLSYLRLQLEEAPGVTKKDEFWSQEDDRGSASFACDHEDHWESSGMSFVYLQKAKFKGLTGTDCELRFLQSVLASATDIQKVTISFNADYCLEGRVDDFQLKLLAHGTWTTCNDDYKTLYKWRMSP